MIARIGTIVGYIVGLLLALASIFFACGLVLYAFFWSLRQLQLR